MFEEVCVVTFQLIQCLSILLLEEVCVVTFQLLHCLSIIMFRRCAS